MTRFEAGKLVRNGGDLRMASRLIGNSLDERHWRFIANPACCEACSNYNGTVVASEARPNWSPHGGPFYNSSNNCLCRWIETEV